MPKKTSEVAEPAPETIGVEEAEKAEVPAGDDQVKTAEPTPFINTDAYDGDDPIDDDKYALQISPEEPADESAAHTVSQPSERPAKQERARSNRQSPLARAEERDRQRALGQAQLANESALISAINTRAVMSDKVSFVQEIPTPDEVAAVVMLEKVFKVIIPYSELFRVSPVDPADFNDLKTPRDREDFKNRKKRFINRMIGGSIPFCLTAYDTEGDDIVFLGSRVRAMETLSRRYFGGARPRYKVGDVVTAQIISVNASSVVVLVGGMDVSIPLGRLTRRPIRDMRESFHVGDEIRAYLTEVNLDENGNISSIVLDPKRYELADAKTRYHRIPDGSTCQGVLTAMNYRIREDGTKARYMYAYIEDLDLFARVIGMKSNSFGRPMGIGTGVSLRVINGGHSEDGFLVCRADYAYGTNSFIDSGYHFRG